MEKEGEKYVTKEYFQIRVSEIPVISDFQNSHKRLLGISEEILGSKKSPSYPFATNIRKILFLKQF